MTTLLGPPPFTGMLGTVQSLKSRIILAYHKPFPPPPPPPPPPPKPPPRPEPPIVVTGGGGGGGGGGTRTFWDECEITEEAVEKGKTLLDEILDATAYAPSDDDEKPSEVTEALRELMDRTKRLEDWQARETEEKSRAKSGPTINLSPTEPPAEEPPATIALPPPAYVAPSASSGWGSIVGAAILLGAVGTLAVIILDEPPPRRRRRRKPRRKKRRR